MRISPVGPTIAVASGIPVRMRCTVRRRLRSGLFSSGVAGPARVVRGPEEARGGPEERDVHEAERHALADRVEVEVASVAGELPAEQGPDRRALRGSRLASPMRGSRSISSTRTAPERDAAARSSG